MLGAFGVDYDDRAPKDQRNIGILRSRVSSIPLILGLRTRLKLEDPSGRFVRGS